MVWFCHLQVTDHPLTKIRKKIFISVVVAVLALTLVLISCNDPSPYMRCVERQSLEIKPPDYLKDGHEGFGRRVAASLSCIDGIISEKDLEFCISVMIETGSNEEDAYRDCAR